jgi:peptide/nickel transport system permease protein
MTDILTLKTEKKRNALTVPSVVRIWFRISTIGVNLSLMVLLAIITLVVFADILATHEPSTMDLRNRRMAPAFISDSTPSQYLLGTDSRGRDMFSRLLYGGRVSLLVGVAATALGLVLGTGLGLLSGFVRGWVDELVMYLVDFQLSLPFLLLAVAVALVLGTSLPILIGLAALATWPLYTRVVRSVVLSLRTRDYVYAARLAGADTFYILHTHLLRNLLAPILVIGTLSIGRIILIESGLSFLGIGVQPPTPSWGNMIDEGREYLTSEWWLSAIPSFALVLLVLSVGTIGDWLRDITDVRT